MNSLEDIILDRVMPMVEKKISEKLDAMKRDMARKFVNTVVSGAELRDILGWSDSYVYAKRRKGELPFTTVNGMYFYDVQEILENAETLNFRNTQRVREQISAWIDSQISSKLRD